MIKPILCQCTIYISPDILWSSRCAQEHRRFVNMINQCLVDPQPMRSVCRRTTELDIDDVFQFFFTNNVDDSRGLLGEDNCGPYADSSLGSGSIQWFKFTGLRPAVVSEFLHGNLRSVTGATTVNEMYINSIPINIFFMKGIQLCHLSTSEPS